MAITITIRNTMVEIQTAQAKALHRGDRDEALRLAKVLWQKVGHDEAGFEFPAAE